ncbi:MAG TPA: Arm DNA-binding domain-containing protein, partial [Burkholderiaceae bacterium]
MRVDFFIGNSFDAKSSRCTRGVPCIIALVQRTKLRWTVAELKALAPTGVGDTLRDGDGLVGSVRGAGAGPVAVHFRYGFKRDGKKAWHYCGTWPATSLEGVRAARDQARSLLKRGLDPNETRTAERIEERQRVQAAINAEARRLAEDASIRA